MFYQKIGVERFMEENKGFIRRILAIAAVFTFLGSNTFAAQPEVTVPHQYPAKYTPEYIQQIKPGYKAIGKDEVFYVALDMLKDTEGMFSRNAILGNNLSERPVKIEFRNLGEIKQDYANFDALGWKKGKNLYIYINTKHQNAPAGAIAALLSHEALHQDEFNSLAEETYAWTMEAFVWDEILKVYPESNQPSHPLVKRENSLKQLLEKGNYTNKYIKKEVMNNPGYKGLPSYSPGFDKL